MAPNAVTTDHYQIQLRPGGVPLVDPEQSPDWSCGDEAHGSPTAPAFYNTQK